MRYLIVKLVVILFFGSITVSVCNAKDVSVTSPDGAVTVTVGTLSYRPYYTVSYQGKTLVVPSHLGFLLNNGEVGAHAKMIRVTRSLKDETWNQVWGEDETVRNHYNEMVVDFKEKSGSQRLMKVVFRVFNDGFGFRYILPHQDKEFCVMDELTEMNLAHDAKAWSIPSNYTEYFEGIYTADLLSKKDTVCTPLTIEYEKDLFLTIHEAALEDYASLNLTPRAGNKGVVRLLAALTPWQNGVKVYAKGDMKSPWRTMIISPTAGGLITSRLMLNLNEPSRIEDTSWIEPGRYIGIWWSIHKKQNTWEMGPTHGATTENVKRYMDFAARHGFSGVLAEGWNPGWGEGEQVTYLRSYPDFDMEEVCRYGASKGVRFIGHTETWGRATLLEKEMDEAFAWFSKLGIRAVKTG
jgi:alpha-glucosidase